MSASAACPHAHVTDRGGTGHTQDRRFGPTIYTVTDQLVKPITAQAGGMSWALMRHPKGKMCDVFITHAWQEGIFEFVDKASRRTCAWTGGEQARDGVGWSASRADTREASSDDENHAERVSRDQEVDSVRGG